MYFRFLDLSLLSELLVLLEPGDFFVLPRVVLGVVVMIGFDLPNALPCDDVPPSAADVLELTFLRPPLSSPSPVVVEDESIVIQVDCTPSLVRPFVAANDDGVIVADEDDEVTIVCELNILR